jgi:ABC-type phosphate transport system auxiliary subunit
MPDEFKKVSARIPLMLLERLEDMGMSNQTDAIIRGLECLVLKDKEKTTEGTDQTAILQARNEELEKHIETLKKELEDLKSMQNNYMVQVQTLINQKAIEAPGAKKPWWRFW